MKLKIIIGLLVTAMSASINAAEKKQTAASDAAMQQAMKYGTPGDAHKLLEPLAGKWNHSIKMWMKPGEAAQESQGTNENTWVLGGRFLKQEAKGNWNGQPFEGMGYTGYDNVRGEYESVWLDNMSTGLMKVSGSYDTATKTIKQSGNMSCPMTGDKEMFYRSEWKIIDNDTHLYTGYGKGPDGKEMKTMEITYKRVK